MPGKRHACRQNVHGGALADAASTAAMDCGEFDRAIVTYVGGATGRILDVEASPDNGVSWFKYKRFTLGGVVAGAVAEAYAIDPVPHTMRFTNATGGGATILQINVELIKTPE